MKNRFVRSSMLILASTIFLDQFFSLPDFVCGLLMGLSLGLAILSVPKFKDKISQLKS